MNFGGVSEYQFEPSNDYQYNGKELEEDLGLNWAFYGFRMYDATIGRFTGVDPISDQFAFVSTYNYAENSPIGNIDLHGLQAVAMTSGGAKKFEESLEESFTRAWNWIKETVHPYDYETRQEEYNQENSFVPGLGTVEGNFGNQRDGEAIREMPGLIEETLNIPLLKPGRTNLKVPKTSTSSPQSTIITAGESAVSLGDDLAFGLRKGLNDFAAKNGFKTYRQFTSGGINLDEIAAAIKNPNNRLHVNIDGISGFKFTQFHPATSNIKINNVTNWELYTIKNTPGALERTTFYRRGVEVGIPHWLK